MVLFGCARIPVLQPFLQLACAADLVGGEPGAGGGELGAETGVDAEDLGGLDAVGEQVAEDLLVHRRAGADARRRW